jgi:capsular exopolysaccharide synthesis family protein
MGFTDTIFRIPDGHFVEIMQAQNIDLKTFVYRYIIRYWYLYLFFLSSALTLAWLKIRYATPIYQVRSTLLIEDEQSKSAFVSEEAIFRDLGLLQGGPRVLNEIQIIRSKPIMQLVIERLGLDVEYYTVGRVRTSECYPHGAVLTAVHEVLESGYDLPFGFKIVDSLFYDLTLAGNTSRRRFGELLELPQGKFVFTRRGMPATENEYKIIFRRPAALAGAYAGNLQVNLINNYSSVLEMSFKGPLPAKSADILNTLAEVYNETTLDAKNRVGKNTIRFIDDRLQYLAAELAEVESGLENYKRKNDIPTDISASVDLLSDQMHEANDQLAKVALEINLLKALKTFIADHLAYDEPAPVNLLPADEQIRLLTERYNSLVFEKNRVLAYATPENPAAQNLNQQILTLRQTLLQTMEQNLAALEISLQMAREKSAAFDRQLSAFPGIERGFLEVKRQQSIKESLFLYLLQKREETAMSLAVATPGSRSVDPAVPEGAPISPNKRAMHLLALLAGILIPSAIVYVLSVLTTTVQTEADITAGAGVSMAGCIGFERRAAPIAVRPGSRSALSEMFRLLRTNIQFLQAGRPNQVLLITSGLPDEGKSFITLNLGLTMALADKKTVLLELDLRRPKLLRYLQKEENRSPGISTYLIGQHSAEQLLRHSTMHPNLYAISSGPLPPNPGELLLHHRLDDLIGQLREQFDCILLDTPPVGVVADALLLGRLADSALYIVRHNQTQKNSLRILQEIQQEQKLPHPAAVLNAVKMQEHYGYARKYGYGHGYYDDEKSGSPWWKIWY